MRWCVLLVLLWVSADIGASEAFLIPENNPQPVYPPALARAGITGEVKVRFTAHSDGSVNKISILKSDHPDLAEAVRAAIGQWRFKPWAVEAGRPAEIEINAPMVFRLDLDSPIHANRWLRKVRCLDVSNDAIRFPTSAWADLSVFHYTRAYLSNVVYQSQLSDKQRQALIALLNERAPGIVNRCGRSPNSRYMSVLPEEIRKLL